MYVSELRGVYSNQKKVCLNGDTLRADCWMGKYGMGVEETKADVNEYKWHSGGNLDSLPASTPACSQGVKNYSRCNSSEQYNTYSKASAGTEGNPFETAYFCERGVEIYPSGFGPN